ncbi:hypothetical protein DPMN_038928 [Dreissena polymorpha]|uniref:Uncharacterized protein n=1 Tax=Dreissena polymorpha TaxID=45954 RepID=A0A9D4RR57_DREPO|nr:hypothetical protein DPMN_038928 [Dreissena polymorpha]
MWTDRRRTKTNPKTSPEQSANPKSMVSTIARHLYPVIAELRESKRARIKGTRDFLVLPFLFSPTYLDKKTDYYLHIQP